MNRVNAVRAIVRPLVIGYCTYILGILVLLEATGLGTVSSEVGMEIVWAFIGITGGLNAEYFAERGVRHFMAARSKRNDAG